MRRWVQVTVLCASGLILGAGGAAAAEPVSEGHPHKWLAVEKGMADFLAEGFELKSVVYDSSETGPNAEPDVHYFLQKRTSLVRCDFRKRDQTSFYWCYRLTAPKPR
jgi:hypothetical protein